MMFKTRTLRSTTEYAKLYFMDYLTIDVDALGSPSNELSEMSINLKTQLYSFGTFFHKVCLFKMQTEQMLRNPALLRVQAGNFGSVSSPFLLYWRSRATYFHRTR